MYGTQILTVWLIFILIGDIKPLEVAISNLAKWQQAEVQRLLDQQERDRDQLKKMFEEQQKNLIKEIMQQVGLAKQSR